MRYYKTKRLFLLLFAIFAEFSAEHFGQTIRNSKRFYLTPKSFLLNIFFHEHKSAKSLHEWSILAVRIAKFGLLREPIRMLLSTMDQFSHIINIPLSSFVRLKYSNYQSSTLYTVHVCRVFFVSGREGVNWNFLRMRAGAAKQKSSVGGVCFFFSGTTHYIACKTVQITC